jgi:hypothetical protein
MRNAKLAKTSGNYDQLSKQVKQDLAKCIVEGGIFIINVDDSEVKYESLYDPDLKEFYDRNVLPSQLMNLEQF